MYSNNFIPVEIQRRSISTQTSAHRTSPPTDSQNPVEAACSPGGDLLSEAGVNSCSHAGLTGSTACCCATLEVTSVCQIHNFSIKRKPPGCATGSTGGDRPLFGVTALTLGRSRCCIARLILWGGLSSWHGSSVSCARPHISSTVRGRGAEEWGFCTFSGSWGHLVQKLRLYSVQHQLFQKTA